MGHSRLIYANGDVYEGDWITIGHATDPNNAAAHFKHGKGVYKFKNGDEYEGLFSNDLRDGLGVFKSKTEGCVYEGLGRLANSCCFISILVTHPTSLLLGN